MEKQFLENYGAFEKTINLLLELNLDSISLITEIHRFIELNVDESTKLIRSFKYGFYTDYSSYSVFDFEEYKNNLESIFEQELQNKYETLSIVEYCWKYISRTIDDEELEILFQNENLDFSTNTIKIQNTYISLILTDLKNFFSNLYNKINTLIRYHSQPEEKKAAIKKLLGVINFAKENECFDYKGGKCDLMFRFFGTYEDIEFNKAYLNKYFENSELFSFVDNTCPHLSELLDLKTIIAYKLEKNKITVYQQLKRYTLDDYIDYLRDNEEEYDEENDDFEEYDYAEEDFDEDPFEVTTKVPDFREYNYYFVTGNIDSLEIKLLLEELFNYLKGYTIVYCYNETEIDTSLYVAEKNLITDSLFLAIEECFHKKDKVFQIELLNKYNIFTNETPYSIPSFYKLFLKNEEDEKRMSFCEYLKSLDFGNILHKYVRHTEKENDFILIKDDNVSTMRGDLPYNFSDFILLSSAEKIKVLGNIEKLEDYHFRYSKNIIEVLLEEGIEELGYHCFSSMNKVKNIELPESIIKIGYGCFENSENLEYVNIKSKIQRIPSHCFFNCPSLKKVDISDSIKIISDKAFEKCFNLDIENLLTIKEIESDAFGKYTDNCPIYLLKNDIHEKAKSFQEEIFTATKCKKLKEKLDKSDLKKEYEAIITSYDNFALNWNVKSIYIADTITDLGKHTFGYYSMIKKIRLPTDIKVIPSAIFRGCSKIKELEIPDNVLIIEKNAFADCLKLEKISIPPTVQLIGADIFNNCNNLKTVLFGDKRIRVKEFLSKFPEYDENQFQFHEKVLLDSDLQQYKNSKYDENNISQIEKSYKWQLESLEPLLKLLKKINKTQLERTLGYKVTSWKENSRPPFEKIVAIAKYFDIDCKDLFIIDENKKILDTTTIPQVITNADSSTINDELNPVVYNFMQIHRKGEPYPENIKLAIAAEYKPLIYGYEKIGKKYGINADMIKDWVKKYSVHSDNKPTFLKSDSIELKENVNPVIYEFMENHKRGEVYPEEIKIAVASEYIPLIYGYERIGKKYGINPDMVKDWVKFYKNKI